LDERENLNAFALLPQSDWRRRRGEDEGGVCNEQNQSRRMTR
jgi:hypothetical protein